MSETDYLYYDGQKLIINKKDIPILMEQLRDMNKVYCVGVTSACYDKNTHKLVGFCGFHDFDGFLPSWDLRARIAQIATAMHTTVIALKTRHGYHILTLQILSYEERRQWKNLMKDIFPSDYIMNKGPFEVLRLTKKNIENLAPKYDTMYSQQSNKQWSSAHLNLYLEKQIIPNEIVDEIKPKLKNTECVLCYYSTSSYK